MFHRYWTRIGSCLCSILSISTPLEVPCGWCRSKANPFRLFQATEHRLEPVVFILFCFSNQIAHPCQAMLLVWWEPVPAVLLGVNGKLPSGSRSRAGHVHPAGLCSRNAAPRQLKEELPSLFFAQGERLGAHCCSSLAALQKKSNLWSPPTSRIGWATKPSLQEIKTQANQCEHRAQWTASLHVGDLAAEATGLCAGWAHTAWPCGSLAAQERICCGSWDIAGGFSTANSAADLLHELRELI